MKFLYYAECADFSCNALFRTSVAMLEIVEMGRKAVSRSQSSRAVP